MVEKIDPDLFARLMRLSASARKDLLEYIGQGPRTSDAALKRAFEMHRDDEAAVKRSGASKS